MEEKLKIPSRAKGGFARRDALSEEQRRSIATKAALSRWGLKATHKGSFKEDFGIDVECYVLNDEKKTAVISQRGMGSALGLPGTGSAFPAFLRTKGIQETCGTELIAKLSQPIKFQWGLRGAESSVNTEANGFDATLLIDICRVIVEAYEAGRLTNRQKNIANQARIIITASAKSGIQNLVYKLAGYDASKAEVVNAFKFFIREEAREYEKEFPTQLYEEWYRLYGLPKPEKNKPWKFKHLTVDQVYKPLAKSNGRILQLTQAQRANSDERSKKLHQFLSEIGVKALRQHLGQLLGISQISKNKEEYEKYVNKVFGNQYELDI